MSELYNRSRRASECVLAGDQQAADSAAVALIAEADAKFAAGEISDAARLAAYGFASDLRALAYGDAQQRHDARLYALKKDFAPAKPEVE